MKKPTVEAEGLVCAVRVRDAEADVFEGEVPSQKKPARLPSGSGRGGDAEGLARLFELGHETRLDLAVGVGRSRWLAQRVARRRWPWAEAVPCRESMQIPPFRIAPGSGMLPSRQGGAVFLRELDVSRWRLAKTLHLVGSVQVSEEDGPAHCVS